MYRIFKVKFEVDSHVRILEINLKTTTSSIKGVGSTMRMTTTIVSLCALAAMCVSAQAAEGALKLKDVSGKVLLQTKTGFKTVGEGQTISTGSRIFVGQEASARITNTDGSCDAVLPAGQVTVIDPAVVCGGAVISPVAYEGVPGEIPPPVVLGVFVAIVAGAAIYSFSEGNDSGPGIPVSAP
jgi:hypothetical protein